MSLQKVRRLLLLPKGKPSITAAAASRGLASPPPGTVLLDFEGVGNGNFAGLHYTSSGAGPDYGVEFGISWLGGRVDSAAGGAGEIANEPSNSAVLFLCAFEALGATVTVPDGLTQLSFQYASDRDVEINVYDGLAWDGNLIATGTLPRSGFCDEGGLPGDSPFCGNPAGFAGEWRTYSAAYSGNAVARSIAFVGPEAQFLFLIDDLLITKAAPVFAGTT
jgi:hypothetical protein